MFRHFNIFLFLGWMGISFLCLNACNNYSGSSNTSSSSDTSGITYWLTKPDQSALLEKQNLNLQWVDKPVAGDIITIGPSGYYQTMDGFGYTLTGGSASVINSLSPDKKNDLLNELFTEQGINISYLRISIGASDLNKEVFTYDDMPGGKNDALLEHFSLAPDKRDVIPLLREILQINPAIKIIATPWTAPSWMKTNGSSVGGKLKPEYYPVYAAYLVKYIQAMKAEGIEITAITPQNEPLNTHNNPSMEMLAVEQAAFIKNHLGPLFRSKGINTKIIIYDHNADRIDYPLEILNDPDAKPFVDGSAFHLYGGEINALSEIYKAHPDKNIYFTEQYTASTGNFGGDLGWHMRNLIIGAPRNHCRTVLEWNLATDTAYGPFTKGGCSTCLGALTIGKEIKRNVAYYIIGHASKFVPPGSVRIESDIPDKLINVAFITPGGNTVVIIMNDGEQQKKFNIQSGGRYFSAGLDAGAVATFVF